MIGTMCCMTKVDKRVISDVIKTSYMHKNMHKFYIHPLSPPPPHSPPSSPYHPKAVNASALQARLLQDR